MPRVVDGLNRIFAFAGSVTLDVQIVRSSCLPLHNFQCFYSAQQQEPGAEPNAHS
jgi:hypothetical protein